MYVNFYGNNLNRAISIPVYVYKINAFSWIDKDEKLDVIENIILELLKIGEKVDYVKIREKIGINKKYEILIKNEIKGLEDKKIIEVEEKTGILKNKQEGKVRMKQDFYVFYDLINQKLLECILTSEQYGLYKKYNMDESKIYKIKERYNEPDKWRIYEDLYELIRKSNRLCESIEYKDSEENEELERSAQTPFYKIDLDVIENIDEPYKVDFLISISSSSNNDNIITLRDPITEEDDSAYIKTYIRKKVEKNTEIEEFLNDDFELKKIMLIKSKVDSEVEKKYKKILIDEDEQILLKSMFMFKEALEDDSGSLYYKELYFNDGQMNDVIKNRLKKILYKFRDTNKTLKIKLESIFNSDEKLKELEGILIIDIILKSKKDEISIKKDKKAIDIIGKSSIKDFLKLIYIATKVISKEENSYEDKIENLFKNKKLIESMNRIWLYRNNTAHRNDGNWKYDEKYDLRYLSRERLREIMPELIEDLTYFLKETKEFI